MVYTNVQVLVVPIIFKSIFGTWYNNASIHIDNLNKYHSNNGFFITTSVVSTQRIQGIKLTKRQFTMRIQV